MYSRAAWIEKNREEEGCVPSNWIVDKRVFWPPGVKADKAFSSRADPKKTWRSFPLIEVKLRSGKSQW